MSNNYSNIIDDHVICYLPFDSDKINKNYGTKSDDLEIITRQNILDSNVPNDNFLNVKSITTSNIENNDFYKIMWDFTQKTFSIEFWFNFINIGKKDDWFFRIYFYGDEEEEDNNINIYRHLLSDSTYYISLSETNEFENNKILTENTWYHFCFERDVDNHNIRFYINGELQCNKQHENTDSIKEMIFYTGWGNEYQWQCNYTNIIISDIIRYKNSNFIPSLTMIPSFKYTYEFSDTKCYKTKLINSNQFVNRNILYNIQTFTTCYRKMFEDHVNYHFDTLYHFNNDTLEDILFDTLSNNVITVNLHSHLKRIPITDKIRKYAFVFSLTNNT